MTLKEFVRGGYVLDGLEVVFRDPHMTDSVTGRHRKRIPRVLSKSIPGAIVHLSERYLFITGDRCLYWVEYDGTKPATTNTPSRGKE